MIDWDKHDKIVDDKYMLIKCAIVGANLRRERQKRGYSTEDLAEFLDLSTSYIGLLERGLRCPSLKCIFKMCDLFNLNPDKLLLEGKATKTLAERTAARNYRTEATALIKDFSSDDLPFVISFLKPLLLKFSNKK